MDDVPRTAEDYGPEDLRQVKAGCLEVATRLGDLLDDLVLTSPPAIPAVAWRGILPFIDRNRRVQTRRVYPGLQVLEFGSARPY